MASGTLWRIHTPQPVGVGEEALSTSAPGAVRRVDARTPGPSQEERIGVPPLVHVCSVMHGAGVIILTKSVRIESGCAIPRGALEAEHVAA